VFTNCGSSLGESVGVREFLTVEGDIDSLGKALGFFEVEGVKVTDGGTDGLRVFVG
jgi:methanogenic corrinoid protein MtbC1